MTYFLALLFARRRRMRRYNARRVTVITWRGRSFVL